MVENKPNSSSVNPIPISKAPTRTDVLCCMWSWVLWIEKRLKDEQTKFDEFHRAKMYDLQTLFSGCKTILSGLKEEELELWIEALEKKLENAVLISKGEKKA